MPDSAFVQTGSVVDLLREAGDEAVAVRATDSRLPGRPLDPNLTFDTFVVGSANRLVASAAKKIVEPGGRYYNPLLVHGVPGSGKTHVLNAVAHHARRVFGAAGVIYDSFEHYIAEGAGTDGEHIEAAGAVPGVRLLLLDDVQFVIDRPSVQDRFVRVWDAFAAHGGLLVLASDRPPADFEDLHPRLLSRLLGGLVVEIGRPDYETRLAIVRRKAAERGVALGEGVAETLARGEFPSVRELQGALNRILAVQEIEERVVSADEAAGLLSGMNRGGIAPAGPGEIVENGAARADPAPSNPRPAATRHEADEPFESSGLFGPVEPDHRAGPVERGQRVGPGAPTEGTEAAETSALTEPMAPFGSFGPAEAPDPVEPIVPFGSFESSEPIKTEGAVESATWLEEIAREIQAFALPDGRANASDDASGHAPDDPPAAAPPPAFRPGAGTDATQGDSRGGDAGTARGDWSDSGAGSAQKERPGAGAPSGRVAAAETDADDPPRSIGTPAPGARGPRGPESVPGGGPSARSRGSLPLAAAGPGTSGPPESLAASAPAVPDAYDSGADVVRDSWFLDREKIVWDWPDPREWIAETLD